ncbi:Metallo-hydrolase/oxidoreductase [Leucogyrophana mollusca]|uniref:Metallo-hydrolase/oxidoreductase n=1 Tax=Leucogyrophana mollusca TaxID=85980 RepID=A0ACB8BAI2_9AGAM|nr:Metallo-hydrolase/oxidoreductase [Leucogyrophana mollusca]
MDFSLPQDSTSQTFLSVSVIRAGEFFIPDEEVFDDSISTDRNSPNKAGSKVPSFAFLLEHPTYGKLLFDLGLRKHGAGYPPMMKEDLELFVVDCEEDIVDQLKKGNIEPEHVNAIIYSHLHFDHVGDLTPFPHATLVVSEEVVPLLKDAYPAGNSYLMAFPQGQTVRYLSFTEEEASVRGHMPPSKLITPLGPFGRALDLFSDGSFYILDAPGHMEGHIMGLVRVAPNKFILLAADCCHHRECFDSSAVPDGKLRVISRHNYARWDVAKESVTRLTRIHENPDVVVVLAHDARRLEEGMPLFPHRITSWVLDETERKIAKC